MTKDKMKELEWSAEPLVQWLNDNWHPHVAVVVRPDGIELVEGICGIPITKFIKD